METEGMVMFLLHDGMLCSPKTQPDLESRIHWLQHKRSIIKFCINKGGPILDNLSYDFIIPIASLFCGNPVKAVDQNRESVYMTKYHHNTGKRFQISKSCWILEVSGRKRLQRSHSAFSIGWSISFHLTDLTVAPEKIANLALQ